VAKSLDESNELRGDRNAHFQNGPISHPAKSTIRGVLSIELRMAVLWRITICAWCTLASEVAVRQRSGVQFMAAANARATQRVTEPARRWHGNSAADRDAIEAADAK
jgi:hypothetical protein